MGTIEVKESTQATCTSKVKWEQKRSRDRTKNFVKVPHFILDLALVPRQGKDKKGTGLGLEPNPDLELGKVPGLDPTPVLFLTKRKNNKGKKKKQRKVGPR